MNRSNPVKELLESILFSVRWILSYFCFGLALVLIVYAYSFTKEMIHTISLMNTLTVNNLLITILEFADVAMIANLIVMIIFGTYSSISKDHNYKEFNLSSGVLKMKMSTSLVGVSSIHLLQTFITSRVVTWDEFYRQCAIHMIFLFGSVSLMWVEKIYVQTENIRKSH